MRLLYFFVALALSILWMIFLNRPLGSAPPVGRFFDPLNGFWANAEAVNDPADVINLPLDKVIDKVELSFDERLVPHVKASNDSDLYFAQGYLHAYYRLWQMDFLSRAAAGRLSEVIGEKTFPFDREQRRKGMVWAAENSLKAMEKNETTKQMLDAYTAGVNAFINTMRYEDLPVEYKLMDGVPEHWTNLKSALLLKYMADDLTGKADDIALSYLRTAFSPAELNYLFPERTEGTEPVIPASTVYENPAGRLPVIPYGNMFSDFPLPDESNKTALEGIPFNGNSGVGSNAWAVRKEDSLSTSSILANDPHLGLSLPSLWYELQLTAPGVNVYGVSIPGAPGIVIGFNDSISWGVTNNYRDVKDYYELRSEDERFYMMDGVEMPFNYRVEEIVVKGREASFRDTIRYSTHGPVIYDEHFPEPSGSGKLLAVCWMAHRATNELFSLYLLNRARNYQQFVEAIHHFECPAQSFVYTDYAGNIAVWGQGRFINKWRGQGRFVMRGDISATLWKESIPMRENPHVFNPGQNYLVSANQTVTAAGYPYWYNGSFSEFRAWEINRFLRDSSEGDAHKMMTMQNSTQSVLAEKMLPLYYYYGEGETSAHQSYLEHWDADLSAESKVASAFQIWWHFLYNNIWKDEFSKFPIHFYPSEERTMQIILADSASKYFDDITTPEKENLFILAKRSFKQTWDSISVLENNGGSEWFKVKNTSLTHLLRLKAFSFDQMKTGGWGNTINAMKADHGPTWRMIVEMGSDGVEAYCNYPGGQSGNPGSKYYFQFIDHWVNGEYYKINFKPKPKE